jgi:8-oxo-dGTP pyrophosphatase MutT (NUDIX family)
MALRENNGFSPRLKAAGEAMQKALAKCEPRSIALNGYRPASVLAPLWDGGEGVQMVFTMRSAALSQHAGQISFPGGGREPEDQDNLSTALRETREEIGIGPESIKVLARLDQMITISDYRVTPFLALLKNTKGFTPDPIEVERMVFVPLERVLNLDNYRLHTVWWQGRALNNMSLAHEGELIWGVTARMLMNLASALGDKTHEVIRAARG